MKISVVLRRRWGVKKNKVSVQLLRRWPQLCPSLDSAVKKTGGRHSSPVYKNTGWSLGYLSSTLMWRKIFTLCGFCRNHAEQQHRKCLKTIIICGVFQPDIVVLNILSKKPQIQNKFSLSFFSKQNNSKKTCTLGRCQHYWDQQQWQKLLNAKNNKRKITRKKW